jgi:hypothetical protein
MPLSILGMVASPQDLHPLDVELEKRRIEESIEDLRKEGLVNLTWMEGTTWRDLQRSMRKGKWHIFHFIGHGGFDSQTDEGLLAFTNEMRNKDYRTATKLGRLLADHKSLRLVLLNSCEGARSSERDIFSSTAAILVRQGIPAVLAMQYEISDKAAIEFSRAFYEALAEYLPVDTCVAEARKAVDQAIPFTMEWGTPVLYMRSEDGILFTPPKKSKKIKRLPKRAQVGKIKGDDIVSFLSSCTSLELTSSILSSKCDLNDLDMLIIESPDQASKILISIARNDPGDGWLSRLCLYICSKLTDPSKYIVPLVFSIAFDSSYSWSGRIMAISWLRFCDGNLVLDQLFKIEGKNNNIDTTRLVLEGYGFMGHRYGISGLVDKHHILEYSYENEKLGSRAILACLNCYVYHSKKDVFDMYPIRIMKDVIIAEKRLEEREDERIDSLLYYDYLQDISRGSAINLFHHLLNDKYSDELLRALLNIFKVRPANHIWEDR